jgi:hypothetical protein
VPNAKHTRLTNPVVSWMKWTFRGGYPGISYERIFTCIRGLAPDPSAWADLSERYNSMMERIYRTMWVNIFTFFLLTIFKSGCGGGESITAKDICRHIEECNQGIPITDCMSTFGDLILTRECKERYINSPCNKLSDPDLFFLCFPGCGQEVDSCEGHILVDCADTGLLYKHDCRIKCERRGLEFETCDVDEFGVHFCACS